MPLLILGVYLSNRAYRHTHTYMHCRLVLPRYPGSSGKEAYFAHAKALSLHITTTQGPYIQCFHLARHAIIKSYGALILRMITVLILVNYDAPILQMSILSG